MSTQEEKLTALQRRVETIKNAKIGAEKEIELLKEQHTQVKNELLQLGISDVSNLPAMIDQIQSDLNTELLNAENEVTSIEQFISSNG